MSIVKSLCILLLGLTSLAALAVIETYQFDSPVLRARYQQFSEELRCPKCQNQNLSGSNSPIAKDLRRELHRLLHEGYSDQQIADHMVDRYGEFVLYRPPVNRQTLILWLAPALLLLIAAAAVVVVVRRQRKRVAATGSQAIVDKQKLSRLLDESAEEQVDD